MIILYQTASPKIPDIQLSELLPYIHVGSEESERVMREQLRELERVRRLVYDSPSSWLTSYSIGDGKRGTLNLCITFTFWAIRTLVLSGSKLTSKSSEGTSIET